MPYGDGVYSGIWFTDRTTAAATYDFDRYLDFELSEDPNHTDALDFNQAHNPWCADSPAYGCAIPQDEDFLDLAIETGEKRWHD